MPWCVTATKLRLTCKKELTLHVSDEELEKRHSEWIYEPKPASGYLRRYSKLAASADKGGVLIC